MIEVKNTQSPGLAAFLNAKPGDYQNAVRLGLKEALIYGVAEIKKDTPVFQGPLKASIFLEEPQAAAEMTGTIYSDKEYAAFIEYGTGVYSENPLSNKQPFTIKPKNGKALKFSLGGSVFFRRSVTIRGAHPAAMFRKNYQKIQDKADEAITKRVNKFMEGYPDNE